MFCFFKKKPPLPPNVLYDHCHNKRWGKAVALTKSSNKTDLVERLSYKDNYDGDTALHEACFGYN